MKGASEADVKEIVKRCDAIEQAKGMLMVGYDVDADGAFLLLKRVSQENKVDLSLVAEYILADWRAVARAAQVHDSGALDLALRRAAKLAGEDDPPHG